jgi:hypothetical protein
MRSRNAPRLIERYLARAIEHAKETLWDDDEMQKLAFVMMDEGYYDLPPEQHAVRGYVMALRMARDMVLKEYLRRPRRRIKR